VKIGNRVVGNGHPPLIVAEMSANHNQSLDRALEIVDAAAEAGADALKIQTYTADTITLDIDEDEFFISDPNSLWKGKSLYKLYQEAYTPWEWHEHIFERCRHHGIIGFSSPFDKTAVDYLENLDVPCYKIASFELVDLPLIKYVAATGKPMILSTGMANTEEIHEAIDTARLGGCKEIAVLHCVSGYPAPAEDYNLRVIPDMIERYGLVTGLSDHTLGNITAITSIAMGASIIEKHFIDNKKKRKGPDISASIDYNQLKDLIEGCDKIHKSIPGEKKPVKEEMSTMNFAFASVVSIKDIKKGDKLSYKNIWVKRPGTGNFLAKDFVKLIGKTAQRNIRNNIQIQKKDLIL
jgi:pseudaminic acid synthase